MIVFIKQNLGNIFDILLRKSVLIVFGKITFIKSYID